MAVVYDDTFDHGLDPSKWQTRGYDWCPGQPNAGNPSETQAYMPSQVWVAGGQLVLQAAPKPTTVNGVTYPHVAGMVTTSGKLAGTYSTIVVRAKWPSMPGLWPAIWLLPQSYGWPPEIDIMECMTADHVTHNLHAAVNGAGWQSGPTPTKLDPSVFHDYGIVWTSAYLSFTVDGLEVQRITDASKIPHVPMYLLINLAVEGAKVTAASKFPADMVVDRVTISN